MYRIIDVIYYLSICLSIYLQYLQGCVSFKIRTSPPKFMTFIPRLNKKNDEIWDLSFFSEKTYIVSALAAHQPTIEQTHQPINSLWRHCLNESPLHPTKSNPPFLAVPKTPPNWLLQLQLQPFTTNNHQPWSWGKLSSVGAVHEVNSYRRLKRNWRNPISQSFEP